MIEDSGFKSALSSYDIIESIFMKVYFSHYFASEFSGEGARVCILFVEKKDGIGLVADYVARCDIPIAAGLEH